MHKIKKELWGKQMMDYYIFHIRYRNELFRKKFDETGGSSRLMEIDIFSNRQLGKCDIVKRIFSWFGST